VKEKDIKKAVEGYYTAKGKEHGPTSQGVDWNGEESQNLRFEQFRDLWQEKEFSLLDFGSGYGALLDYLKEDAPAMTYTGFDISQEMIDRGNELHSSSDHSFTTELKPKQKWDYVLASGLFNVRLDACDDDWLDYILEHIALFDSISQKGFAFNVLSSYSDLDKRKDYLYYADPLLLFDLCKRKYSRNVRLIHDYNLYEFTLLVKKV